MNFKRPAIWFAIIVLAICVAISFRFIADMNDKAPGQVPVKRNLTPPGEVTSQGVPESTAGDQQPQSVTQAQEIQTLAPLPETALPLHQQLPQLLQRAEQGEPIASCRLIVSINRCREERRNKEFTDAVLRSLGRKAGENDTILVDVVASSQEEQARRGGYCDQIDTSTLPEPEELFKKAMHRLSPHHKTVLAMTRSDGSIRRVNGNRTFSESELYVMPQFLADHTLDFLMEGYAAKDPLALEGLVMVHSPGNALTRGGVSLWLPNPRLFLFYSNLMVELYGPQSIGQSGLRLMQSAEAQVSKSEFSEIRHRVTLIAAEWRRQSGTNNVALGRESAPERAFEACK